MCLLEIGICGDGVVQTLLGEQCESSTHDSALPYTCNNCHFLSSSCGNGSVDPGEECDEGAENSESPDADCRSDCSLSRCGDKIVDSVEECDDGNRVNGDGCDRDCRIEQDTQVATESQRTQQTQGTFVASQVANAAFNPFFNGSQVYGSAFQQQGQFQQYPQYPQHSNYNQLPYQLPLAQLRPLIQSQGPIGDTGPAAVAVIGAGAAAGLSWIRRKRK